MKIQVQEKDGIKVFLSRYCAPEWVETIQCGNVLVDLLYMVVLNSGAELRQRIYFIDKTAPDLRVWII